MRNVTAACWLLLFSAASSADFSVQSVADGVYVHQGRHVGIEDEGREDIANIGFIIGAKCVAVIDTGGSVAIGAQLREAIRGHTPLPVCYVINTHEHYDHLLGNVAFRGDSPEFIGHSVLPDAVEASRELFLEQYPASLGNPPDPAAIIAPARTVEDTLVLDLGDRKVELRAWPTSHSHTDVTVHDLKTGTMWFGDLLFVDRVPILDGSVNAWIDILEELRKLPLQHAIPGHGPVAVAWPGGSDANRQYLVALRDKVRGWIANGLALDEAIDAANEEDPGQWLLFAEQHGRNVSGAYTELEWE